MKLFGGSDSKKKQDIEKIKEIRSIVDENKDISSNNEFSAPPKGPPQPPIPPQRKPPAGDMHEDEHHSLPPEYHKVIKKQSNDTSPPLFIKIDRYKEIVREIHKMRSLSLTLRDALDALFEMEKEIKGGLEMAHKTLDTFNATLLQLDGSLIRSHGIDNEEPTEESKQLEEYVRNIYKQVNRLRNDMKTIAMPGNDDY